MIFDIFCKCGRTLEIEHIDRQTIGGMRVGVSVKPCTACLDEARDMGREDAGKEEA